MICESCIESAVDYGAPEDIAAIVCRDLGSEIADHNCEASFDSGVECMCGCKLYRARAA